MAKKEKPIGIDLFCGVGGLSLGFRQAGFDVVASVDHDPTNVEMYSQNFPNSNCFCGDISKLSGRDIRRIAKIGRRRVDVIFGGPPCQGFSMIGKRRVDDSRNSLIYEFARLVREIKPNYFIVENVPGILTAKMKSIVDSFKLRVKRAGYAIIEPIRTVNALEFGVPQRRQRVVILGHKKSLPAPSYSRFVSSEAEQSVAPTVWDAIGDLVKINDHESFYEENIFDGRLGSCSDYAKELRGTRRVRELSGCQLVRHTVKTVKRFEKTEPGTTEAVSHFYRLEKTGVAPTLRAGSDSSRGLFTAARPIHPTLARCITTREAARLHSFPDWFQFHSKKCHAFRQIGNSVPPKMAKALAQGLLDVIEE